MFKKLHDASPDGVTVYIDGLPVPAEPSENVATILLREAELWARTTPVSQARRAPYCMMGACYDCLALVDGVLTQTCLSPVRDGMHIERQLGSRRAIP